jgi:adenosylcobinamide-phosphate synthase
MIIALAMAAPLLAGWLLDLLLGDPIWLPNPANLIQGFTESLFSVSREAFPQTSGGGRSAGLAAAMLTPVVCLLAAGVLLATAFLVHPALWLAFETLFCYQMIGARKLGQDSRTVYALLAAKEEHGDLSRARLALSKITDEDTAALNSRGLSETAALAVRRGVTERAVAPMFWLAVGGGACGAFYRAVNRLAALARRSGADASATPERLDQLCGLVPRKITALLLPLASRLAGYDSHVPQGEFPPERILAEARLMYAVSGICALGLTAVKFALIYLLLM